MKDKKISCEIIRDLLPSYVDGLTSEASNEAIREHLAECSECTKVKKRMTGEDLEGNKEVIESPEDVFEKKEIDFLKKTRKKNIRNILIGIILIILACLGGLYVKYYVVGFELTSDEIMTDYIIDGNKIEMAATSPDSATVVKLKKAWEDDGQVNYEFKGVMAGPFSKMYSDTYIAETDVREIVVNGSVIWSEGTNISSLAEQLFAEKHEYVGDVSLNGATASTLRIAKTLGNFKTALYTSKKPYVFELNFDENTFIEDYRKSIEETMKSYAYAMLGTIGNLDTVRFVYIIDGKEHTLEVTKEDASRFFGQDIKNASKSVKTLQKLLEKSGLADQLYINDDGSTSLTDSSFPAGKIALNIKNMTGDKFQSVSIKCYKNGKVTSSGTMINADESNLSENDMFDFQLSDIDFASGGYDGEDETYYLPDFNKDDKIAVRVSVTSADGVVHETNKIELKKVFGVKYLFKLTGSSDKGYKVEQ